MVDVPVQAGRQEEGWILPSSPFCSISGLDGDHTGEDNLLNSLIQVLMLQPHPETIFSQDTPWPKQVDM